MRLEVEKATLETRYSFTISRDSRKKHVNFIFALAWEGITGYGEAAPRSYYGEGEESVVAAVERIGDLLEGEPEALIDELYAGDLGALLGGDASVRAALDMALWDIVGKREGVPCYRLFSLDPARTPLTSYTIGFDTPEMVRTKLAEADSYPILKLKMGLPGDLEILDEVIARSGKTVRVDANEGWNLATALRMLDELRERRVEFVEQPISHYKRDDLRHLKLASPVPVMLDESVVTPDDVDRCRDLGHGINIKLMKCGGLTPALEMIKRARAHGLQIMLGCMIESSLAITAAAHLSPLADYADLDGNLLLATDPFSGVRVERGKLILPDGAGLGVEPRPASRL